MIGAFDFFLSCNPVNTKIIATNNVNKTMILNGFTSISCNRTIKKSMIPIPIAYRATPIADFILFFIFSNNVFVLTLLKRFSGIIRVHRIVGKKVLTCS